MSIYSGGGGGGGAVAVAVAVMSLIVIGRLCVVPPGLQLAFGSSQQRLEVSSLEEAPQRLKDFAAVLLDYSFCG